MKPHSAGRRGWLRSALAGMAAAGLRTGLPLAAGSAAAGLGALSMAGCAVPPAAGGPVPSGSLGVPVAQLPPGFGAVPEPVREFRGAWVATVANIDWPSRSGLSVTALQAEALHLLDRAAAIGLNALLLQVRPAADAIYPSALEPFSEVLTGEQGRAPEGGFDPLAFWIDEAHRRGLELHAWFNPYRARHASARSPLAPGHIALRRPDLVRRYGDQLWLDPAEPEAAEHTLAVVADVLARYAVDGVHIDDYFYPYPVRASDGTELPFPDDAPWARDRAAGGTLARADWRRRQVDALVERLHATVRRLRPGVRFGISPFGLPQPAFRPAGITGFSQYDQLYADVERWLREGWMDYCAPQLYWAIDRPQQAFGVLADTWPRLNPRGLAMWPGLFTSRIAAERNAWPADEVLNQVALLRERPAIGGHIHFSLIALAQDRGGIARRLAEGPYAGPALVPEPWAGPGASRGEAAVAALPSASAAPQPAFGPEPGGRPGAVALLAAREADAGPKAGFDLRTDGPADVRQWSVWRHRDGRWAWSVQPGAASQVKLDGAEALVVSAIGPRGLEGPRTAWWPGLEGPHTGSWRGLEGPRTGSWPGLEAAAAAG